MMPEKETNPPRSRPLLKFIYTTGETVKHKPIRDTFSIKDLKRLEPGTSAVNHQWKAMAMCQADLSGKHVNLGAARRVVVVVIESALPDRYDFRCRQQRFKSIDSSLGVVGMNPSGRPDSFDFVSQGDHLAGPFYPSTHSDQTLNPC